MISKPSQTRIEWNWKSFQFSFSLKPNKGIEKNRIANEINSTFPQTKRTVNVSTYSMILMLVSDFLLMRSEVYCLVTSILQSESS